MICGETVFVISKDHSRVDEFGEPIMTETSTMVDDVLVAPAATLDVDGSIRPDGKKVAYRLHFPKTFFEDLTGCDVMVRGERFAVIGTPRPLTLANTPTQWWMPVDVEAVRG